MSDKTEVLLITCGLTIFNIAGVYWMLDLFETGFERTYPFIIFGAIFLIPTILMNILCIVSLVLPWPDESQQDYSKHDYKRAKKKLKKSLGWRVFKEIIDILD